MGCPAALDLADVATSGCFAALGPLSCRCFATECVRASFLADALPPWSLGFVGRCFAVVSLGSLADALLSRSLGSLADAFAAVAE
jgi:hypothetical protein